MCTAIYICALHACMHAHIQHVYLSYVCIIITHLLLTAYSHLRMAKTTSECIATYVCIYTYIGIIYVATKFVNKRKSIYLVYYRPTSFDSCVYWNC